MHTDTGKPLSAGRQAADTRDIGEDGHIHSAGTGPSPVKHGGLVSSPLWIPRHPDGAADPRRPVKLSNLAGKSLRGRGE
jgi:hypothetical protein